MRVSGYSGDAGDDFSSLSGMSFTTFDLDHDTYDSSAFSGNCAIKRVGGCGIEGGGESALNGVYQLGKHYDYGHGIYWDDWGGSKYSLAKSSMMIRRLDISGQ
ncbi:hypothetical protein ScPMuIL_010750 [Solemya velum]